MTDPTSCAQEEPFFPGTPPPEDPEPPMPTGRFWPGTAPPVEPEPTPPSEPFWRSTPPSVDPDPPVDPDPFVLTGGGGPAPTPVDPPAPSDTFGPAGGGPAPDPNPAPPQPPVTVGDSFDGSQAAALGGLVDDQALAFNQVAPAAPPADAEPPSISDFSADSAAEPADESYGTSAADLFAFWFDWDNGLGPARKLPPDWLEI